jgi:hypothetical protein
MKHPVEKAAATIILVIRSAYEKFFEDGAYTGFYSAGCSFYLS